MRLRHVLRNVAFESSGASSTKREAVCREEVERISQEFVRARAEAVEPPAERKHLGEFRIADEIGGRTPLQRVEAHGDNRVSGLDQDELAVQMLVQASLAGVDRAQEVRRRIAVEIEEEAPTISLDVLLHFVPQKETLAGAGLPKHRNVHRAPRVAHAHVGTRHLTVHRAEPEIKTPPFVPSFAVPDHEGGSKSLQ